MSKNKTNENDDEIFSNSEIENVEDIIIDNDLILDNDYNHNIIDIETDSDLEIPVVDSEIDLDLDIEIIEEIKSSKHKEIGKHSLKYDSIFKGKKDDSNLDEYFIETASKNNTFDPDSSSAYSFERESPTEYTRLSELRKELYNVIVDVIKLNIKNSRRKPARSDFNIHYGIIVDILDMEVYSYSEVFIEFAYYFSDNIENMFKLLDKKWGGKIAQELAKRGNIRGAKNLDDIDFM